MKEEVRAGEPGYLRYEWFLSDDQSTIYIVGLPQDSAAVMAHLAQSAHANNQGRVSDGGNVSAMTSQPGPGVPAARADSVSKVYRLGSVEVPALFDVSLSVEAGEMACITGKSGSGKSTLLRQLGLIDRPTSGHIELEGREVSGLSESRRAALRLDRLGYVFQEYALIPALTAQENVYLPALMKGQRRAACRARATELLGQVGLGDRMTHRPKELSGGEQQRVAIARALVNWPAIIFADEPTANLDSISGRTVMETLTRLNRELGVTIVFVSHDPDDRRWATRLVSLRDGRIESDERAAP